MFPPKIKKVLVLPEMRLLVSFNNGINKVYNVEPLINEYPDFCILTNPSVFNLVKVDSGGCGVSWTEDIDLPENELWLKGITV